MPRFLPAISLAVLVQFVPSMGVARTSALPEVMVVGVAHLVRQRDLHNSTWGSSVFAPGMQRQILV